MVEEQSLIKVPDLSKPATVLIEKISNAIAGAFRPRQIRRIAAAEADAELIRASGRLEVADLERRALSRLVAEETKRQQNIESITEKALLQLDEGADPTAMQDDWITAFFDKCRSVSDEQMQSLWSRVLAGEANAPGKYSKRILSLIADFDKADADMFSRLCCFSFQIGDEQWMPLIYDETDSMYTANGVDFETLSHLESIGLVKFNGVTGFVRMGLGMDVEVRYFGLPIQIGFPSEKSNSMSVGRVLLTKSGQQLASICGAAACDGFVDYARQKWKDLGYRTSPPA